jgi:hypothetical protein
MTSIDKEESTICENGKGYYSIELKAKRRSSRDG